MAAELQRIPKGEPKTPRQGLRLLYNYERSTDLPRNPDCSPFDALTRVIEMIWRYHPDLEPDYDRSFFHPRPIRGGARLRLVATAD